MIGGDASIQIAGEAGKAGRQITASSIDVTLAPDGSTPTALVARDERATHAAGGRRRRDAHHQGGGARRRRRAWPRPDEGAVLRATWTTTRRARPSTATRGPPASTIGLKAGLSAFDQAAFSGGVRFADQKFFGTAASMRYVVDSGSLDLTGSEPGIPVPHVQTDQIAVDAPHIEVALAGPTLHATGNVKSVLRAAEEISAERRRRSFRRCSNRISRST